MSRTKGSWMIDFVDSARKERHKWLTLTFLTLNLIAWAVVVTTGVARQYVRLEWYFIIGITAAVDIALFYRIFAYHIWRYFGGMMILCWFEPTGYFNITPVEGYHGMDIKKKYGQDGIVITFTVGGWFTKRYNRILVGASVGRDFSSWQVKLNLRETDNLRGSLGGSVMLTITDPRGRDFDLEAERALRFLEYAAKDKTYQSVALYCAIPALVEQAQAGEKAIQLLLETIRYLGDRDEFGRSDKAATLKWDIVKELDALLPPSHPLCYALVAQFPNLVGVRKIRGV